jgi:hypothetical protein
VNLTHWLRKSPRPVALMADGTRVDVPKSARAWSELAATIAALEPSKLTALDAQGDVLRSIVLESDDKPSGAASSEMSDVQLFAKLIAEAYEKGQKSNQPIIDSAMGFTERISARLARSDTEIDRLRAVIHKQQVQIAQLSGMPAESGGEDSLLSSIIGGALQAAGAGGANPLANLTVKPGGKK